ncbi:MAG: GNAT family N-acetyltransferase [Candidatus Berkiella sp.]
MKKYTLIPATQEDESILSHLWPFYVYDLTRYCGHKPGWHNPTEPTFKSHCVADYYKDPDSQIYLLKMGSEHAGFMVIKKPDFMPDVDWFMAEFFIVAKFQRSGLGHEVAIDCFNRFKGKWAVGVLPENAPAFVFWQKTISQLTRNHYQEVHKTKDELKTPEYPNPYPMNMFLFTVT